jgi:hypothetical protein
MRGVLAAIVAIFAFIGPLLGAGPIPQTPADHIAHGGVTVPGWLVRPDGPDGTHHSLSFMTMGAGMHVTTGPAAILWNPDQTAAGQYIVSAWFGPGRLPDDDQEAYGLFIGGADLKTERQQYTCFVISKDGKFLITKRSGVHTKNLTDTWAEHRAIRGFDPTGVLTNELAIRVGRAVVSFVVNGHEVASHPASAVDTSGIVGIRVNHDVDMHVEGFSLQRAGA